MAASAPAPSPAPSASTIRAWCAKDASVGRSQPVIGPPDTWRAADTIPERCSSMRLPASWIDQRVVLGVGARERQRVTLTHGVPHDLDHVDEPLLDFLAPVPGGEASGERLDRPAQLTELAALVVALRPKGAPLDDVGVEEVPVADGTHARAHVRPGAHQALGLQHPERLTDHGAGDLETLADLLRARGRSAPRSPETIIWPSCWTSCPCSPRPRLPAVRRPTRPAQGLRRPRRGRPPVGTGSLDVGVAVKPARADETGVCGAGGGHHGVRKGTHGSFVGSVFNSLEVFGEKHTKG